MKPRMTQGRKIILEKLQSTPLAWGFGEQGGKEYFFTDGSKVNPSIVDGMIGVGLLRVKEQYGMPTQEIEAA